MRVAVAILLLGVASCGGGSGGSEAPDPPPLPIVVSPPQATAVQGGTQPFTVSGVAVRWSVQESGGGSIDSAGIYTAPNRNGTFHVVATALADSRQTGTATVTVIEGFIAIVPSSDVLGPGGVREFMPQVTITGNNALTWTVLEGPTGGTMNGSTYTAPDITGTFHVVATSVARPNVSATATVTVVTSGFRPANDMVLPRTAHTATLLPNGQVLITGGDPCFEFSSIHGPDGDPCPLQEAELYDPVNGAFLMTGSMFAQRATHAATLLPNGRVLITGGGDADAEFYEPSTETFTLTGSMSTDRSAHTATLLPNGKVLVAGGAVGNSILASAEVYDPQSGTFSPTGGAGMTVPRISHTATRLQSGMVLLTGGLGPGGEPRTSAELYDPIAETFTVTGGMNRRRARHTATLLANGTVLVAAGSISEGFGRSDTAEIYDPASGTFSPTIPMMVTARDSHFAVVLPSGIVLVSGGEFFFGVFILLGYTTEIYDPATGSFTQTGSMSSFGRVLPAAVTLADGRVLVTGGSKRASTEIYQ